MERAYPYTAVMDARSRLRGNCPVTLPLGAEKRAGATRLHLEGEEWVAYLRGVEVGRGSFEKARDDLFLPLANEGILLRVQG